MHQQQFAKANFLRRHRPMSLILLLILFMTGCSAGGLAIRYLYSRLDNNLVERMLSYAEFSARQESEIRLAVDRFALWHRTTELPRYADLIESFTARLASDQMTEASVFADFDAVRGFFRDGYRHSPVFESADFLRELSNSQVEQISQRFSDQDERFMEWYEQRKQDPGRKRQLASIVKNLRRIGIRLSPDQQDIIVQGLLRYQGTPLDRHRIWGQWEKDFIKLLRERQQGSFPANINQHLAIYQEQMKIAYPERDRRNRQNTVETILAVVQSLDGSQKAKLIQRLRQASSTLRDISGSDSPNLGSRGSEEAN